MSIFYVCKFYIGKGSDFFTTFIRHESSDVKCQNIENFTCSMSIFKPKMSISFNQGQTFVNILSKCQMKEDQGQTFVMSISKPSHV